MHYLRHTGVNAPSDGFVRRRLIKKTASDDSALIDTARGFDSIPFSEMRYQRSSSWGVKRRNEKLTKQRR